MNLSFRLDEIAACTGGRIESGRPEVRVQSLATDSRTIRDGDWFIALRGERQDGHAFAADVLARGAAGVILSRKVPGLPVNANCLLVPDTLQALQHIGLACRRRSSARVIGITGSNGKTSTKDMAACVLAAAGKRVLATRGNLNSQIGLPLMLMELDAPHTHAVLEMGASERGNLTRLASLARPGVAVITNIGRAHMEFFGSLEAVLEAKWELAASLPEDGTLILNADDPLLFGRIGTWKGSALTFGVESRADVRAEDIRPGPEVQFRLLARGFSQDVRLPVPGLFNVYNALAASAVALTEGVPLDVIAGALSGYVPSQYRMQVRRLPDGSLFVLDAYNANPSSMRSSLESFVQAFPEQRKMVVLGSMLELGASAEADHKALGELLASLPIERVFFLGPEGSWVRSGFSGGKGKPSLEIYNDKDKLSRDLEKSLSTGSATLFKASRGIKLEEVFNPLISKSTGDQ
ncbi:MAG: UDP-N-acetylmuramoyl-tripeptide--D-alanyl-D-alanine ligase [Elusimicrobia bacterium]|nr:UDP-N-acetylmuramoyl-tripeptide--D-alanyl-D-alanine ligase [Elusimicrobiota bacterium]